MKISGGASETLFFGELFQHESGSLLVKYLARRAQEVCLVVPTSARRHLAAGIPCPVATVQDVFANPLRAPNLLVHVQTDERRIIAKLRQQYGDMRVLSLAYDVLPALCSRSDPLARRIDTPSAASLIKYAIICPPRSGSTWLCEMLTSCGVGAPLEHLRPPILHLSRCARLRPVRFMSRVLAFGARDGIFGTKLVTSLLRTWRNTEALRAGLARRMAAEGFAVIVLKRRDRVAQAISFQFARRSRIAHVRDPARLADIERAQIGYDFRQIDAMYRFFAQQEALADRFARAIAPSVLRLDYEDIQSHPAATVRKIAGHIGVDPPSIAPRSNMIKISSQVAIMREYGERYRREAGLPPSS